MNDWPRMTVQDIPKHLTEGRNEWRRQNWQSLYIGATSKIVARRIGDNRGARMIRFGLSGNYKDTVSNTLQTGGWACSQYVVGRIWVKGQLAAGHLDNVVKKSCGGEWDWGRAHLQWWAAPPDLDLDHLLISIRGLAYDCKLKPYFDNEAISETDRAFRESAGKVVRLHTLRTVTA